MTNCKAGAAIQHLLKLNTEALSKRKYTFNLLSRIKQEPQDMVILINCLFLLCIATWYRNRQEVLLNKGSLQAMIASSGISVLIPVEIDGKTIGRRRSH
jgi:hypothetical protein